MGTMTTSVLLINRQLVFAVTIKQALEQTGVFIVHPFTSADAALDYLRDYPHDVALVDFTLPDYNGPQLVRRLRAIQPGIAVIVSPAQPNARALMQDLDLQGVVDAPFSARTIIPVIEHAVELIEQPLSARTRSLVEDTAPEVSATEMLVERNPDIDIPPDLSGAPQFTRMLDDTLEDEEAGATSPRPPRFDAEDFSGEDADDDYNMSLARGGETRVLDDLESDEPQPWVDLPAPGGATRVLDDSGFDEDEALPWERSGRSRVPDDFSTLDSILMNEAAGELFEPPVRDEDTPAVPTVDSDAVRQFLATRSGDEDDTFGRVLGAIDPESELPPGAASRSAGSFADLVNSMRADRQHTPLPDRHQQFIEFIMTGGMDNLLTELEKAKTGELEDDEAGDSPPESPPDTFTTLAAEEPPLPTLEESGTIGDLMIGVSDTSFRNVLALMRGEQVPPGGDAEEGGFEKDFEAFFGSPPAAPDQNQEPAEEELDAGQEIDAFFAVIEELEPPPPPPVAAPPRREADSGIPARMILETAQDESTPADSFSLDTLIDDIERQLEQHLPDIKPLPSWGESFKLPRRPAAPPPAAERFVQEPDFLPETFVEPEPVGETPALPTWDDEPDEAFETTLASQTQREQIEGEQASQETEAFFAETEQAGLPEPDETPWPDAEPDIAGIWESFVPASAYQDEDALAEEDDEELLEFEDEPSFTEETLVSQSTPVPPPEEYPDWLQGLLPGVQPETAPEPVFAQDDELPEPEPEPEAPAYTEAWSLVVDQAAAEETTLMADEETEAETEAEVEALAPVPAAPDYLSAMEMEVVQPADTDDTYIAQLALSLTQVSLELTAEATMLTRDGEIVAVAGTLAPEDVDALRVAVSDEWAAGEDDARIRFLALDGGREYMLYSRKTVGGFTLSMIFGGTTPLRDIRRQGKRLLEALAAVPETPPAPPPVVTPPAPAPASAPAEPSQPGTLVPYTYVWLLRDPDTTLNEAAAHAIVAGLRTQLSELGWQVQSVRAQDEYVYVYADVPGERAAYAVADDLKHRAASILRAQGAALDPQTLWADSYLVLTPGRELDDDEIAQFVDFERTL